MYGMVAAVLAAGPDDVIGPVEPTWGPFGALGDTARTLIGALMAVGMVVCVAYMVWGAAQMKVGSSSHNSLAAERGKSQFVSGLIGLAVIGSIVTLATLAYGMGLD